MHSNYDKYPSTKFQGRILRGWDAISGELCKAAAATGGPVIIDTYTGVHEDEIAEGIKNAVGGEIIFTRPLMKPEAEIKAMTEPFMTADSLFGHVTALKMEDFFVPELLDEAAKKAASGKRMAVIGPGAAMIAPENAVIVYADMARWEIQMRFRKRQVCALGVDNRQEPVTVQYKRGYFNDWRILDTYKSGLFEKAGYRLDTNVPGDPKMIDRETFFKGIEITAKKPFRVVPFFDPAPWGGQWMKEKCDLDRSVSNFGWCFDCVPEENSLYFEIDGIRFEMPSVNLVLLKSRQLLGEPVEARFGKDFPIRFDFLDTVEGGNLSLQVHPTTQFIKENFGMNYTQDESYYLLDAVEGATVYIGLKTGVDKEEMLAELRKAQKEGTAFDVERYVNRIPAKKHDHFLIPGGTVHCSGSGSLVLEISSTPNIFTFKLYDWQRLGLDGKPRPINIERGSRVIDFGRDTEYVEKYLHNCVTEVARGEGWYEEKTGLHRNEFIETRRHHFSVPVHHNTGNSVNVLNLLEGEEAVVESPSGAFEPFVVHYAETFIIPACVGDYTISPCGKSLGKECVTVKASVRC